MDYGRASGYGYGGYGGGGGGYMGGGMAVPAPQPPQPPSRVADATYLEEKCMKDYPGSVHTKNVNSLAWNLGGGRLATGSDDKTARVYEVDNALNIKPVVKLDAHSDAVVKLCWDPTSPHRMATVAGWKDKAVRVFDLRTGSKPAMTLKMAEEYINLAWSPDGHTLAAGSENAEAEFSGLGDGEKDCMTLIDVRKAGGAGKPPTTVKFPYQIEEFCFSPNSKFLLLTTELGTIEVEGLPQTTAAASNSQPVAASSSSSSSSSSSAVPPSPSSSSSSVSLNESPLLQPSLKRSIQAHPGNCCCVGVDPSGKFACVGSKDSLVSVWDLEHLASVRTLGEHTTAIRSLSFSWDGSFVASTSYDSSIDVSCLGSGVKVAAIDTQCAVKQVAWQPAQNSRLLAVARDAKKDDKDEAAARARLNRSDFVFLVQIPKRDLTDESGLMSD